MMLRNKIGYYIINYFIINYFIITSNKFYRLDHALTLLPWEALSKLTLNDVPIALTNTSKIFFQL